METVSQVSPGVRRKNRRLRLALAALVLSLAAISAIAVYGRLTLPTFEGKTIEVWFEEAVTNQSALWASTKPTDLSAAFVHFGAKAQPFLLKLAQRSPPLASTLRDRWGRRLPRWLRAKADGIRSEEWYIERRCRALEMLGFVETWEQRRPG